MRLRVRCFKVYLLGRAKVSSTLTTPSLLLRASVWKVWAQCQFLLDRPLMVKREAQLMASCELKAARVTRILTCQEKLMGNSQSIGFSLRKPRPRTDP
eukprot:252436-Amphidinium_carterae.2